MNITLREWHCNNCKNVIYRDAEKEEPTACTQCAWQDFTEGKIWVATEKQESDSVEAAGKHKHAWYTVDNGMGIRCDKCDRYANMMNHDNFSEIEKTEDCIISDKDFEKTLQG